MASCQVLRSCSRNPRNPARRRSKAGHAARSTAGRLSPRSGAPRPAKPQRPDRRSPSMPWQTGSTHAPSCRLRSRSPQRESMVCMRRRAPALRGDYRWLKVGCGAWPTAVCVLHGPVPLGAERNWVSRSFRVTAGGTGKSAESSCRHASTLDCGPCVAVLP